MAGLCTLLCTGSCLLEKAEPFEYLGEPGQPERVSFYSDTPTVEVTVEDALPMPFLLDTGAPVTLLDAGEFGRAEGVARLESLQVMGLTVLNYKVALLELFAGELGVGGILGGDVLRHFAFTLDYADGWAYLFETLGGAAPTVGSDLDPPFFVPFELRGGGLLQVTPTSTISAPATRVVVQVWLEGVDYVAVLDTGASSIVLDENLFVTLMSERPERPTLTGLEVIKVDGTSEALLTRLADVLLDDPDGGSAQLTSVPAMVVYDSATLSALSEEVDRHVDLLLGASYLRAYQLTIDYPAHQLCLQPYRSPDHIDPQEYVSVGFVYEQVDSEVRVTTVFPTFDADSQGVQEGDRVVQVNGLSVNVVGISGIDSAVRATDEGSSIPFTMERSGQETDYDILVEDLLPGFE